MIPHGHSVPATVHLIASQPVSICPLLEYLIKWNEIHQFFLEHPVKPVGGQVTVPTTPGIGMDLDPSRIESRKELSF